MLLTIDLGNTNITVAAFNGKVLRATWRMKTDTSRVEDEYRLMMNSFLVDANIAPSEIDGVILSSVVPPLDGTFQNISRTAFGVAPLIIDTTRMTMMKILVDHPDEVGADRLVNTYAAHKLYSGPLIVIDFGTATTFDIVSAKGAYMGGAICGGVQIVRDALYEYTAKLPRVEILPPKNVIGKNTVESIRSGVFFGHVALVEGMVSRFKKQLGAKTKVIATGGLVDLIRKETKAIDIVNPILTLQGLRELFDVLHRPSQKSRKSSRRIPSVFMSPEEGQG